MRMPEIKFHAKKREYYCYLNRKYRYLGRSKADAERVKIRILAAEASCEMIGLENRGPVLVVDLVAAFLNSHQDSSSLTNYRLAGRYLAETFAITPVSEFGPNSLRAVREKIVASGVSRQYINKLVGVIRSIFNWGVSHEMVSAETAGSLKYVRAIGQRHSISPESPQVTPVNESDVAATLPFLSPTVAAMVQLQLITGMRPSEVCELRLSEIDRSASTWTYTKSRQNLAIKTHGEASNGSFHSAPKLAKF